ncbi:Carbonic anhydrase, partial [Globisporangium splendens]
MLQKLFADLKNLLGNDASKSKNRRDQAANVKPQVKRTVSSTSTAASSVDATPVHSSENSPRVSVVAEEDQEDLLKCQDDEELKTQGLEQSPIDICAMDSELVREDDEHIEVVLGEAEAEILHAGSNFKVEWGSRECNYLKINGKIYYTVQFHFHAPSEHTLSGNHEAMELHLVHQADDGSLAVIALFFREGKENQFLAQFWDALPGMSPDGKNTASVGKISAANLDILKGGKFYRYRGSLTTPPYTEGVQWIIMQDVVEASREQLEVYRSTISGPNARPVQARNHRLVTLHQCSCP